MIEAWQRVLVLAPHTDDGEFGCGGTMARLVEAGADVRYVAFSIATKSLPEGFAPDTLAREVREATAELGIPEANLTVHDFEVRTFPERRQDILELLIALWEEWRPDAVFQPSLHDVHQDHQVVAAEGLRAFKRTTILGYEIPWNNFDFAYQWYSALEQAAHRAEGGGAREVRVAAAPPLRRPGVHLERRPHARDQREPRVRRGVPGLPRRRLDEHARLSSLGDGAPRLAVVRGPRRQLPGAIRMQARHDAPPRRSRPARARAVHRRITRIAAWIVGFVVAARVPAGLRRRRLGLAPAALGHGHGDLVRLHRPRLPLPGSPDDLHGARLVRDPQLRLPRPGDVHARARVVRGRRRAEQLPAGEHRHARDAADVRRDHRARQLPRACSPATSSRRSSTS